MNSSEIAKLAHVSRTTVSRVLNGHGNVSESTRQRVEAVIREHNYFPDAAARNLVGKLYLLLPLVILIYLVSSNSKSIQVAAAIANDGVMMEPRLLSLVESPTGKVRLRYSQKVYRTACSPEMAQIVDGYMKDVVKSGTGTRAQVSGLTIAGKTGSAEGSDNGMDVTHAWFVGYIDSDQYPYAISVLVENGGSGGSVAAPVARQVFEYLRDNLPS